MGTVWLKYSSVALTVDALREPHDSERRHTYLELPKCICRPGLIPKPYEGPAIVSVHLHSVPDKTFSQTGILYEVQGPIPQRARMHFKGDQRVFVWNFDFVCFELEIVSAARWQRNT
jgi:hypothetical protein